MSKAVDRTSSDRLIGRLTNGERTSLKRPSVMCVIIAAWLALAAPAIAQAFEREYEFRIEEETLGSALDAIVQQTELVILYPYELAEQAGVNSVIGQYTVREALEVMLRDTQFSGGLTEGGVMFVSFSGDPNIQDREGTVNSGKVKKGLLASVSAFMFSAGGHAVAQEDIDAVANGGERDTIVVTATKREESLQDVASQITVISNEDIARRGLVGQADFLNSVPGVSMIDAGIGQSQIVIRGIAADRYEQATVTAYLGEVPLTQAVGGLGASADVKLVDIERVEVLSGPQGTLFGSGSLGGAIRYIPVAPDTESWSGSIMLDQAIVDESDDTSSRIEGMLNIPLVEDKLALRLVGYRHDEAGYIDFINDESLAAFAEAGGATIDVRDDVNSAIFEGFRATMLWTPTDRTSITAVVGLQDLESDTRADLFFASEDYEFSGVQESLTFQSETFRFGNLVIDHDLGWATVTSSTNYSEIEVVDAVDISRLGFLGYQLNDRITEAFAQEIRLVSSLDGPLNFVIGGYYEDYNNDRVTFQDLVGDNAARLANVRRVEDLQQYAVFGEASYEIVPKLTATFGGRWFTYDRRDTFEGVVGANTLAPSDESTDESGVNLKANLSYKPTDDLHLYAQWSEGFRLGLAQPLPFIGDCDIDSDGFLDFTDAPLDRTVESDSTNNYEIGAKFTSPDRRITANAAVYRIDWEDIPVRVRNTSDACPQNQSVLVNVGEARSIGVEADLNFQATPNLNLFIAGSYKESEFREGFGSGIAEGDPLPVSPDFNGRAGFQYEFDAFRHPAFIRADYQYVGEYVTFAGGDSQGEGDYGLLNARVGLDIDGVSLQVYARNLTGENAILDVQDAVSGFRVRPREIGIRAGYSF